MGVSLLISGRLGVAPFDAVGQGLAYRMGIEVGTALWIVSAIAVVLSYLLGHRPGIGTLAAAFGVGLIVNETLPRLPEVQHVGGQALMAAGGFCLLMLGISLVIGAHLGAGAVDLLMLSLADPRRLVPHLGLRRARWLLEGVLLLAAWLLGGDIGVVTVLLVLLTGPVLALLVPRVNHAIRPGHSETGATTETVDGSAAAEDGDQ